MYDIIGDIHGQAEALKNLLDKLGYNKMQGYYQHPNRKAIFLGDFINKGNGTKEVLYIVKSMVDHGAAYAVVGNHELYLIGYFTKNRQGDYIRPHTTENEEQHRATFEAFKNHESQLYEYMAWFKTLPIYMNLGGCRIVHAYWHQKSISYLQQNYPENCLSDRLLNNLIPDVSEEWNAVRELLIGVKLKLPASVGGEAFKTKWWRLNGSNCYFDLAIRPDESKGSVSIPIDIDIAEYTYPKNEKPLFFGHYNLPEEPFLIGRNYCCLDFGLPDREVIPAYRWNGEQQLISTNLIY